MNQSLKNFLLSLSPYSSSWTWMAPTVLSTLVYSRVTIPVHPKTPDTSSCLLFSSFTNETGIKLWNWVNKFKVQTSQSKVEFLFSCHVRTPVTFASVNAMNRAADCDCWRGLSPVTLVGPLGSFFPRRHPEVNKKKPWSRRSTRQGEHCSESRLCSVITCNHFQLPSFSC